MTFQTVPINITGPSYQDRSRPLSSQETRNFYHEATEAGKEKFVIKSFPGQKVFGTATAGVDRGSHQMAEVVYRVVGDTLWEVSSAGTHTNRGTLTSTSRCIFADDGVNLFIVADGIVNQYDSDTTTLSTVTDVDIVGAQSVAFINNQFAYTFPQLTVFSDVGDGSSASGLNAVNEESTPDDLVRDYEFDQILWRFGKRSVVNWWNSGTGTPPFQRIEGQYINVGLCAIHSVATSREFIYWLGSDKQIYRARGGQEESVTPAAIAGEIQGYGDASDAYASVFTIDNKTVYLISFPTADKTWLLFEELGIYGWIELTVGTLGNRFNAGSVVEAYNRVLIGDLLNGNLNELDFNTYDIDGDTWQRRRVVSSINSDLLGAKGQEVRMGRLELILESGTGLITGQGEDPQIMIELSLDGGRSWGYAKWVKIGRLGQFNIRAQYDNIITFYDCIVRLTTSDPVAFNLYSGTVDLKLT